MRAVEETGEPLLQSFLNGVGHWADVLFRRFQLEVHAVPSLVSDSVALISSSAACTATSRLCCSSVTVLESP